MNPCWMSVNEADSSYIMHEETANKMHTAI